jgi:hypothetical protein
MHDVFFYNFPPFLTSPMLITWMLFIGIVAIWSIVLKGFALWYSARAGQHKWFIVLLVVNTAGILEMVYFIWFRPKTSQVESVVVPVESSKDSQ